MPWDEQAGWFYDFASTTTVASPSQNECAYVGATCHPVADLALALLRQM
jgi:hypothetical protein